MKNQSNDRELNQRMLLLGILSGLVVIGIIAWALWYFAPSWFAKEKKHEIMVMAPAVSPPVRVAIVPTATPTPEPVVIHEKLITAPALALKPAHKVIPAPKAPQVETMKPHVVERAKRACDLEETHAQKNKQFYRYDVTEGGPVLHACPNVMIETSLDADFKNPYLNGHADEKGEFRVSNPPPGALYWRVDGDSTIHKLVILDAQPMRVKIQPTQNLKSGDRISWTADENASFYRVEVFAEASLVTRTKMFSTKKTSIDAKLVAPSPAFIRVGALNLKKGLMEFTDIQEVTFSPTP